MITVTRETGLGLKVLGGINRNEGPFVYIQEVVPGGDCYKVKMKILKKTFSKKTISNKVCFLSRQSSLGLAECALWTKELKNRPITFEEL